MLPNIIATCVNTVQTFKYKCKDTCKYKITSVKTSVKTRVKTRVNTRTIARKTASQVSCGLNHTLCASRDGNRVWSFGDGDYGKLGLGNTAGKKVGSIMCSQPPFIIVVYPNF